jgi:hypothetical protein
MNRAATSGARGRLVTLAGVTALAAALLVGLTQTAALAACVPGAMTHKLITPSSASGGSSVAGAKFGAAMVTGDFNKDGFADLAVGAPGDQVGGVAGGTVSVFYGSSTGLGTGTRLTEKNVSGWAIEAGDQFGASLAAGDFNKDGAADLAVGAPGETIVTTKSGAIVVFAGSASGLSSGRGLDETLSGESNQAGDQFGASLAGGDLNGDGFADLAIGTPGKAPGTAPHGGFVIVFKGSSSGVAKGWITYQKDAGGAAEAGDKSGAAMAIGNVTGDSHADLVVGAPGEAPGSSPAGGEIYVVPGAADGKGTGFGRTQANAGDTIEAGDNFGASVAVGNFDKDGFADIAVGVPGEKPGNDPAGAGSIAVFPGASGSSTGFGVSERQAGVPPLAGDKFGASVAAGEVDGDGFADLLVGAPGRPSGSVTAAGVAYLFGGLPRKPDTSVNLNAGRPIRQADVGEVDETSDAFGSAVAFGDLDKNGKAEAVIGASGEAPTGLPASGEAASVSGLVTCGSVPVEQFSPTTAMQLAPVPGASAGALEYAYVDNIGRLVHGNQSDPDNTSTVQWTVISGNDAYTGQPALAQQPDGRLQVTGHNADSGMRTNTQATASPPAWGSWVNQGGLLSSGAAVVRPDDGRLVAFAVDPNGVLWSLRQSTVNGPYTTWDSFGNVNLIGTPTAVPISNNGVQLFTRDSSGALLTALYSAGTLSAWTSLGGTGLTGSPTVVIAPGFSLRVFVRAADGTILTKKQDATGVFPQAWEQVGTFVSAGSPSAVLDPTTGKVEVMARGADGAIYETGETQQGSGMWRDWVARTDPIATPSIAAATDPTMFTITNVNGGSLLGFVIRNSDNQVWLFTEVTGSGALAADAADGRAAPGFIAHKLPPPPR